MGCESHKGIGARFCYGACFGFGFVASAISLIIMFWILWCYVGIVSFQVSESQRRALVHYPVTTSKTTTTSTTPVPSRANNVDSITRILQNNTSSVLPNSNLAKNVPLRGTSRGQAQTIAETRKDSSDVRSDSTKGDFASRDKTTQYMPAKNMKELNLTETEKNPIPVESRLPDRASIDSTSRSDSKLAVILSGNENPPRYGDDKNGEDDNTEAISVRVVSSSAPDNRPLYDSKAADRADGKSLLERPKSETDPYGAEDLEKASRRAESIPSRREEYDERSRPYDKTRPSRGDLDDYDKDRPPVRDYLDKDYDRERPIERVPSSRARDSAPRRYDDDPIHRDPAYEKSAPRRDSVASDKVYADRDEYDRTKSRPRTSYRERDLYDDDYDRSYAKGSRRYDDDDDEYRYRERERVDSSKSKGDIPLRERTKPIDDKYRDVSEDTYKGRIPDERYRTPDDRYRDRVADDRYRSRYDDDYDRYKERKIDDRYIDRTSDDEYRRRRPVDDRYTERRLDDDREISKDTRYRSREVDEKGRKIDDRDREYDDRYRDRTVIDDRRPEPRIRPRDDTDTSRPRVDESRYRDEVGSRRREDDKDIPDLPGRRTGIVSDEESLVRDKALPRITPARRTEVDLVDDRKTDYGIERRERPRTYPRDERLSDTDEPVDRYRDRVRDEEYRRRTRPSYDRTDDDTVITRSRDEVYERRKDYVDPVPKGSPQSDDRIRDTDRVRIRDEREGYAVRRDPELTDRYRNRRVDDEIVPDRRRIETIDKKIDEVVVERIPPRRISDPDYIDRPRSVYVSEDKSASKSSVTQPEDVVLDHRSYAADDVGYSRNLPRTDSKYSSSDEDRYSRRDREDIGKGGYRNVDDDRIYRDRRRDMLDDDDESYKERLKGDYGRGRTRRVDEDDYVRREDARVYDRKETRYLTDDPRKEDLLPDRTYDERASGSRDRRRENRTDSRIISSRDDERAGVLDPDDRISSSSVDRSYIRDRYPPSRSPDNRRYPDEERTIARRDTADEVTSSSSPRGQIYPNIKEKRYQGTLSTTADSGCIYDADDDDYRDTYVDDARQKSSPATRGRKCKNSNKNPSASSERLPQRSYYDDDLPTRPLTPKEVIEAAYRHSEVADRPGEAIYPVYDPRVNNMTSPEVIRPSERRGTIITTRKKKK